jgi:hypothetical protein
MSGGSLLDSETALPGANVAVQLVDGAGIRSAHEPGAVRLSAAASPNATVLETVPGDTGASHGRERRWPPAAWPPIDDETHRSPVVEQSAVSTTAAPETADRASVSSASWPEVQPWPRRVDARSAPASLHTFDAAPTARRNDNVIVNPTATARIAPVSIPGPLTMPGPSPMTGQGPFTARAVAHPPVVRTGWSSGNTPTSLDADGPTAPQSPPPWPGNNAAPQ